MEIKVFTSFSVELKENWLYLETQKSNNSEIFSYYFWSHNWYENVGQYKNIKLSIAVVYQDNVVQAIFPFCIVKKFGIKILTFIGELQSDYSCPLTTEDFQKTIEPNSVISKIYKTLPHHDIKYFKNIPEITRQKFFLSETKIYPSNNSQEIIINTTFERYKKNLRKKLLQDTARQRKKLSKFGNLRFVIVKNSHDEKIFFENFYKQKSKRYISTGERDIFKDQNIKNFYKSFTQFINKRISLSYLILNDEILATHLGVFDENKYYFLMPTFNHEWSNFSTGRLLMEEIIIWAFKNKFKVFDFTIGDEVYKLQWSNNKKILYDVFDFNTLSGFIFWFLVKIKNRIQKNYLAKPIISILKKIN